MEYKITFLNDNEEHTIAELGENALENAQNSLEVLLSLLNTENCKTGVLERLFNYGLEFCPVPYNEDEGGKIEYYCYLIPYGGPSKEVRFYPRREVRFYPHRTEFVYLDWSSGVGFDVSSDEIFQQLRDWFGDLLDFSAEVMIGSSVPCFANEMFICRDCGRNLGDRYSRLKGKKQPDIIIINDKHYCSKCADKHFMVK